MNPTLSQDVPNLEEMLHRQLHQFLYGQSPPDDLKWNVFTHHQVQENPPGPFEVAVADRVPYYDVPNPFGYGAFLPANEQAYGPFSAGNPFACGIPHPHDTHKSDEPFPKDSLYDIHR